MPTALEIDTYLRRFVVGQDEACKTLAVAAAQHYARSAYTGDTQMRRANVIIVGPTGVGKTAMVRALARFLDVPFASVTASAITQPGFSGLNPDEVLRLLLAKPLLAKSLLAESLLAKSLLAPPLRLLLSQALRLRTPPCVVAECTDR